MENAVEKITTEMAAHVCDNLCRFPRELSQEELEERCCNCKFGGYMADILNEYNKRLSERKSYEQTNPMR